MTLLMKITGNVLGARPSSHPVSPQAFPGETWRRDNSPSWKSRPVCELSLPLAGMIPVQDCSAGPRL